MDESWNNLANSLGHTSSILPQTALDNYDFISSADVVIISSGLIDIPFNRVQTLKTFAENGGRLYIQSEFLVNHPGNAAFHALVNYLGGSFQWNTEDSGSLAPMSVTSIVSSYIHNVSSLNYYWYGTSGIGDNSIIPLLQKNGKDYGFIFCPSDMSHGKIITTSDQDWIRVLHSESLMENILTYLIDNEAVGNAPTVFITADNETPCPGEEVTFSTSITNEHDAIQYQWLLNGSPIAGAEQDSLTTNNYNEGDVFEAVISLDYLCDVYEHVSNPILMSPIVALATPHMAIQASELTICENEEIIFTSTLSNETDAINYSFQWNLNGQAILGATSTQLSLNTLANGDEITIDLIYDNICASGNIISSNFLEINVAEILNPAASLTTNANQICEGEDLFFTIDGQNLGDNPSFQWIINGSSVASGSSNSLTVPNVMENQEVSVMVSPDGQCTSTPFLTAPINVAISQVVLPEVSIDVNNTITCEGEPITFTATSLNAGTNPTYEWLIDGIPVGDNSSIFESSTLTNGQVISCNLSTALPCASMNQVSSNLIPIEVILSNAPTVSITANSDLICEDQPITFTAIPLNAGESPTFTWQVDGLSTGQNSATFTTNTLEEGQEVSCTIISNSICSDILSATSNGIQLNENEFYLELLEQTESHCSLNDALAEIEIIGGLAPYEILWSNGGNQNIEFSLSAGEHEVKVSDASGCLAKMTINIIEAPAPEIMTIEKTETPCGQNDGQAKVIMASNENYFYQWKTEDGAVFSFDSEVKNLASGNYSVDVQDDFGCRVSSSFTIEAFTGFELFAGDDIHIKLGEEVKLQALVSTTQDLAFSWFGDVDFSCQNCQTTSAKPLHDINIIVQATLNGECYKRDTLTIFVEADYDVYVPNAFSPNDDGVNDYFTAFGGDQVEKIKTMKVFNRWGSEIYSGTDLPIGIEHEGWDGNYKGKKLDSGVYVYFLELQFIDGQTTFYKGDVSIMANDEY